jgi:sucrose-6-phosphate hydrolase SacC (GH32 family)
LRRYYYVSCNKNKNNNDQKNDTIATVKPLTKADSIVKAIESHGGDLYKQPITLLSLEVKNIVFTIKERTYSTEIQKEITIQDVMTSETFERAINGQKKLSPADASKYA